MRGLHVLFILLPLGLVACGGDSRPTEPSSSDATVSAAPVLRVVNSLADPGDGTCNVAQCTLREALNDPARTRITFAPGLSGVIRLARPDAGGGRLEIDRSLALVGPDAGITIRRPSTDPAYRILLIDSAATVTLKNLTIQGAQSAGPLGAILNRGRLALINCKVVGNLTDGINSIGPLTLTNTTVANNTGGGISAKGTVTLTSSAIRGNGGTGLYGKGSITIDHSTVSNNTDGIRVVAGTVVMRNSLVSQNRGGGVLLSSRSGMTLDHVRVVRNAGGGIALEGSSGTLTNSTVAYNSGRNGGGIYNNTGSLAIAGSTIMNNSATGQGGGIFNTVRDAFRRRAATVTLTNSTVSGNSAEAGGGIANWVDQSVAHLRLTNSTVTGNSASQKGGGITGAGAFSEDDASLLTITNSLIAGNSAPTGPDLLIETGYLTPSFDLIGDGSGSGVDDGVGGNQVGSTSAPIDPRLGPLSDNGGPTRTHALLAGSPAIDAASTPDCPTTDQRGVSRPQGPACDIGSYER